MYKNNLGPYLISPNIDINDEEYIYEFLNPETNVRYKFAVIGENDYGMGNVDNFTEAILTLEGLELKYLQGVNRHYNSPRILKSPILYFSYLAQKHFNLHYYILIRSFAF